MKINRGRVREGDVPPLPREARKLLGGPLLAIQTIYQYFEALNWGERLKIMVGGGGGGGGGGETAYPKFMTYWSGMEQNVFIRISHLIEQMVVVRFGLDTRSGLCDNWSVGL